MREQDADVRSITGVPARLGALARLRGELARRNAQKRLVGGGVALAGVVFLRLALLAGLAAIIAGIATVLDVWLAILIVFGGLLLIGTGLVAAGVGILKGAKTQKAENGTEERAPAAGAVEDGKRDKRSDTEIRDELAAQERAIAETIRRQAPVLALGAFAVGFVVSGGIGATLRPLMRKRW